MQCRAVASCRPLLVKCAAQLGPSLCEPSPKQGSQGKEKALSLHPILLKVWAQNPMHGGSVQIPSQPRLASITPIRLCSVSASPPAAVIRKWGRRVSTCTEPWVSCTGLFTLYPGVWKSIMRFWTRIPRALLDSHCREYLYLYFWGPRLLCKWISLVPP